MILAVIERVLSVISQRAGGLALRASRGRANVADLVNLNRFRKKATKAQEAKRAEANRARFGRSKSERDAAEKQAIRADHLLEQHRIEGEDGS